MLQEIRSANPSLLIKEAKPEYFSSYGRVLQDEQFLALIQALNEKVIPATGNVYTAHDPSMDFSGLTEYISQKYYSEMPIQIGHCNGHTHALNAFEYHQGNEINFMATDCILMLAHQQDIKDGEISSGLTELFYFPAGTVIELYGTTLHYAPCALNRKGFRVGVILPFGTNQPLQSPPLSPLVWGRNKWLICHPEAPVAEKGAYSGITGENISLRLID